MGATNAEGTGPWSESGEGTTGAARVPAKPAGFTATAGNGRVLLSWNDPGDATITKWQYEIKKSGAAWQWHDVTDSAASTTSYEVTGLDNGTRYHLPVQAEGGARQVRTLDEHSRQRSEHCLPHGDGPQERHQV